MATLQNFAYTGNPITEEVSATSAITRVVKDESGNTVATLSAEPYGGKAHVQYEAIIRSLYKDGRVLYPNCLFCMRDKNISAKAIINGSTYIFSRGVSQIGGTGVCPQLSFLTTLKSLRWYLGYELGVVYADPNEEEVFLYIDNGVLEQDGTHTGRGKAIVFCDLSDNPYGVHVQGVPNPYDGVLKIANYNMSEVFDSIRVQNTPVPAHPFYVRWINDLGGYDYWMFSCRQKYSRKLSENTYFENSGSLGVQTSLSKQVATVVEVSSGLVNAQTMEALANMPASPDIRWYNESAGAWIPVQIEKGDSDILTDQPTGELILSFVLPTKQMNK